MIIRRERSSKGFYIFSASAFVILIISFITRKIYYPETIENIVWWYYILIPITILIWFIGNYTINKKKNN